MTQIRVPCSPEQEEVIFYHAATDAELGILPDERAWIMAQARTVHPGCTVTGADLDIENGTWVVDVELV